MHIVLFLCNVFHRHKKIILFIELSLHYFKKKTIKKKILLYVIVTVSRGIYLGIFQSMKHKFLSIAGNT